MTATTQTTDDSSTDYDYYLLCPETDLPTEVLADLPSGVVHWYPQPSRHDHDWAPSLDLDAGEAYILRVDTTLMEVATSKVRSVIHPEPAGATFSSASQTTFNSNGFLQSHPVDSDTIFALDTTCLELTNTVGHQYQLDRRGE